MVGPSDPRFLSPVLGRKTTRIFVLLFLICPFAFGSSVLLRAGRDAVPEPAIVNSATGPADVSVSQVRPATSLTVVWLLDALDSSARDAARTDLLALYSQLHGRVLRLAVVSSDSFQILGPFESRVQLGRALASIEPPVDTSHDATVLDTLILNAAQLGSNWSSVLIVGDLPKLDVQSESYAQALLSRVFSAQRLRAFLVAPSAGNDSWSPVFACLGGAVLHEMTGLIPMLEETKQVFLNVAWAPTPQAAGFTVISAAIVDSQGQPLATAIDLATSLPSLPSVHDYTAMRQRMTEAAALLQQQPQTTEDLQHARDLLAAAVRVNPADPAVLRVETVVYERTQSYPEAVKASTLLTQVAPADGGSFLLLGQALLFNSEFDKAGAALDSAAALKVPPEQLSEPYLRLHLGKKDERGALPYLDQILHQDPRRQDLWFLQAQTAEHLQQPALAIRSLEQGLALGGVHVSEASNLVQLYVSAKDTAKARAFALSTIQALPSDVHVRTQFAEVVDEAKLSDEAIAAWRGVLAVQPDVERARVRVARMVLESGNAKASEQAADDGLQVLPKSGQLYLVKTDAVLNQGQSYAARDILEQGATVTGDPLVLARLAVAQEVYGDRAPDAYAQSANALGRGSPERGNALEQGFRLSLRDGDLKRAAEFATTLEAEGHPEYRALLGENREAHNDLLIPGGLYAFSVVAGLPKASPDRLLGQFARQVVASVCRNNCIGDEYTGRIQKYFATISQLESLGHRDGNRVTIILSLSSKDERSHADDVLRLLGLRMRVEKNQVTIDRGENKDQAKKQEILSALQFDDVSLQDALQAGKPYAFTIEDEPAAVYPSLKTWQEQFPHQKQEHFVLMLLHAPWMAQLYIGIGTLDHATLATLIGHSGLYWFMGHPADMLALYGTSFALQGTHAMVPGGLPAEPVWSQAVGASPDQPAAFFQTLLLPRNSILLAYFYELSNFDQQHQSFLTANATRFNHFYTLFAGSNVAKQGGIVTDTSLTNFLRSVPLDDKGRVAFPGSPELWTVAKGHAADDKKIARMLQKVSRTATPEVEDEILLRLAGTSDKSNSGKSTELDNFLAVSRIDAHRGTPLDEESALLLAQHYAEFSPAYAYFTDLNAISSTGFHSFFDLFERIRQEPLLEQNQEMGQVYSLLEWVVLLERRHTIRQDEAARLFSLICERTAAAGDEATRTLTSLELAATILADCGPSTGSWDDTLRSCLLPDSADSQRVKDYEMVLDEQKAPRFAMVRPIFDAVEAASLKSPAPHFEAIASGRPQLPSVSIPKGAGVTGKEKESILEYDPAKVEKLVGEWDRIGAKSPDNLKNAQKLAGDLLKDLTPQVTAALAAPIYAYFLRAADLVVSEDPLLLRKHRYLDFVTYGAEHQLLLKSAFTSNSDGLGSYMEGGFAEFGLAAGSAASAGWKQGGSGATDTIGVQIAAIRSTDWDHLRESDQRLAALRILAAREWIVQSASDPASRVTLSESTAGLLSLARRADLLNGIEERDWPQVWASITLPDLFRLGGEYLQHHPSSPAEPPVATQLRTLVTTNDGTRLDILASIPNQVLGCSHTHFVADAPYEEYERRKMPSAIAERAAEFKLFLAYRADSLGIAPADLAPVAETLAAKAFRASQMADYHDWRSLLNAYASLTNADLRSALQQ